MNANYELRLDDLKALLDLEKTRFKSPKVLLFGSLLLYGAVLAYAFTKLPRNSALMLLLPVFVYVVTLTRAIRVTAPGRAKVKHNFCGMCELRIELDGLTEIRSSGELKRNWSAIDRIVKTKTHLFIYATGMIAFVLPRRAFGDDVEFNRFVKAVQDRSTLIATDA